jgi:hypothetical protein
LKKSRYFSELLTRYSDELDDLATDSEGRSALQQRLADKRSVLPAMLSMIEFSPEMVAVMFYDAFEFKAVDTLHALVQCEPEFAAWSAWDKLRASLRVQAWAEPMVAAALKAEGGDAFLVATAGLEFLRLKNGFADAEPQAESPDEDGEDEDVDDLGEAGSAWLSEQGFESHDN